MSDRVTIYNRPATVEKALPDSDRSIVRWQDNGTQGVVQSDAIKPEVDQ